MKRNFTKPLLTEVNRIREMMGLPLLVEQFAGLTDFFKTILGKTAVRELSQEESDILKKLINNSTEIQGAGVKSVDDIFTGDGKRLFLDAITSNKSAVKKSFSKALDDYAANSLKKVNNIYAATYSSLQSWKAIKNQLATVQHIPGKQTPLMAIDEIEAGKISNMNIDDLVTLKTYLKNAQFSDMNLQKYVAGIQDEIDGYLKTIQSVDDLSSSSSKIPDISTTKIPDIDSTKVIEDNIDIIMNRAGMDKINSAQKNRIKELILAKFKGKKIDEIDFNALNRETEDLVNKEIDALNKEEKRLIEEGKQIEADKIKRKRERWERWKSILGGVRNFCLGAKGAKQGLTLSQAGKSVGCVVGLVLITGAVDAYLVNPLARAVGWTEEEHDMFSMVCSIWDSTFESLGEQWLEDRGICDFDDLFPEEDKLEEEKPEEEKPEEEKPEEEVIDTGGDEEKPEEEKPEKEKPKPGSEDHYIEWAKKEGLIQPYINPEDGEYTYVDENGQTQIVLYDSEKQTYKKL